jgi:hypothetical protein
MDDEALAGSRESRRSCAFCLQRAIVQCDGDRCIRQLCADHQHAIARLVFCPVCEPKVRAAAATPEQMPLFNARDSGRAGVF